VIQRKLDALGAGIRQLTMIVNRLNKVCLLASYTCYALWSYTTTLLYAHALAARYTRHAMLQPMLFCYYERLDSRNAT
jgi:hypothetical protein